MAVTWIVAFLLSVYSLAKKWGLTMWVNWFPLRTRVIFLNFHWEYILRFSIHYSWCIARINSSSVFDFSLFWLFALNTDHWYKCPIDGMDYLQLDALLCLSSMRLYETASGYNRWKGRGGMRRSKDGKGSKESIGDCHTRYAHGRGTEGEWHAGLEWGITIMLALKVLNFWKFTSCCSLKPLWLGLGEVV